MSAQEALFEVDNFLSRALMAGLPSVTVIHGKGTGVLRNAVTAASAVKQACQERAQRCVR